MSLAENDSSSSTTKLSDSGNGIALCSKGKPPKKNKYMSLKIVNLLLNQYFTVSAKPLDSVSTLKYKIEKQINIASGRQVLLNSSNVKITSGTLAGNNIRDGSCLKVAIVLRLHPYPTLSTPVFAFLVKSAVATNATSSSRDGSYDWAIPDDILPVTSERGAGSHPPNTLTDPSGILINCIIVITDIRHEVAVCVRGCKAMTRILGFISVRHRFCKT